MKFTNLLREKRVFLLVSAVLLFLSFFLNIFGVGYSQDWFAQYQTDSKQIVEKTAQCKENINLGPLFPANQDQYTKLMSVDGGCSSSDFQPYFSQFGLQSRVFSFFAPSNDESLSKYFNYIEAVLALVTTAVFVLFLWKVRQLFGLRVASIVLGLLCISIWVVAFARNTYWISFLLFLPFVFSFVTYQWFRDKKKLPYFYLSLGVLFLLKFLNGYEYASTLVVSAFVPVLFYEIYSYKLDKLRLLWKKAALILLAGLIGLITAISINVISLNAYTHSTQESIKKVISRAEIRAGGDGLSFAQPHVLYGFEATNPELYASIDRFYDLDALKEGNAHPLKYAILSVFSYLMLPVISLPVVFAEPIGSIAQSFIVIVLIVYACLSILKKRPQFKKVSRALFWSFTVALAGSISWLLLMPAHMYPHVHINGILFYMPTLLIGYVIVGLTISTYLRKRRGK